MLIGCIEHVGDVFQRGQLALRIAGIEQIHGDVAQPLLFAVLATPAREADDLPLRQGQQVRDQLAADHAVGAHYQGSLALRL
jgi:hypothetical protein